jgi:hypothetical protein
MSHVVLLGDSIFDNASYVGGGPDVVKQLRDRLPSDWRATLRAVDGNVTRDVERQLSQLPRDTSHLVVDVVRNPGMVSFVIDIGDPAVLQIGSIIWIVRDSRRTREELVSIGHIAEDNAMEASNAADSFIRGSCRVPG